jgi:hypothetical protein
MKKPLIIIGMLGALAAAGYLVYRSRKTNTSVTSAPLVSLGDDEILKILPKTDAEIPSSPTASQKQFMDNVCGNDNWKCRKAIRAGILIPSSYTLGRWGNVPLGKIYEWAYHIKYESKSGNKYELSHKLIADAEWQAAQQIKKQVSI